VEPPGADAERLAPPPGVNQKYLGRDGPQSGAHRPAAPVRSIERTRCLVTQGAGIVAFG